MNRIKILTFVFTLLVLPYFFVTNLLAAGKVPTPSPKPLNVDSYELFWPLVAGKVQGDSFYFLKTLKEKMRGGLIFSNLKKAEYNALLSEKRLLEFEKLALTNKDYVNSAKTLESLKIKHNEIAEQLIKAKGEGLDISAESQTITSIFEKEKALMQSILGKIEDSQKTSFGEALENLVKISSKIN